MRGIFTFGIGFLYESEFIVYSGALDFACPGQLLVYGAI
jgi:hypothetical protein